MNKDVESIATSAYLEHMNRHTWKRIVPKPFEVIKCFVNNSIVFLISFQIVSPRSNVFNRNSI